MTTLADFRRWSFRQKLSNPFAGLRVRWNGGLPSLSRHWPHLLCWSWLLALHHQRKWNPLDKPALLRATFRRNGQWVWKVAFLWRWVLVYGSQPHDEWMPALGPRWADAPKIDWDAERARRNA